MSSMSRLVWSTSLCVCVSIAAACGSKSDQDAAMRPAEAQLANGSPAASPPAVPAPAVTQAAWTPDAIEELVAPIALYPDQLLGQIFAASVNAQEVLDGGNWLLQNESLSGDQLDAAAQKAGFGPAMRALVQFPTVVDMMCQQIDWTRQLGSAFTSDQKSVLDAVQRLRAQAAEVGNLKSTPEQKVETKKDNDKLIVEVKPADPKVVYVPQYDPQVVYTTPPPAAPQQPASATTTTASSNDGKVSAGAAVAGGLLAFGVGVMLGHAMDDDDDYCYPHWGAGVVYYGPRPFYPPAYVYRPAYGPAFHPAYRYAPPPGYRHSYNNIDVNVNRNIVVNNNSSNYFNRFSNNQNLRVGGAQSPLGAARQTTQTRLDQPVAAHRTDNWRGQSTYTGAGGATTTSRVQTHDVQTARSQHVDRGYGESTRAANRDAGAIDHPARAPNLATNAEGHDALSGEHAFSGADRDGNGSFERSASARGRASASGRSERVAHTGRRR